MLGVVVVRFLPIPEFFHGFSCSMGPWMFKFKLVLIVHFVNVCVVSAIASGERVGLSTIIPPDGAMKNID